jgi:hypothetical protein
MNKTFALLMTLLIFYGVGGGAIFFSMLLVFDNIYIGIAAYLIYIMASFLFLLELAGT